MWNLNSAVKLKSKEEVQFLKLATEFFWNNFAASYQITKHQIIFGSISGWSWKISTTPRIYSRCVGKKVLVLQIELDVTMKWLTKWLAVIVSFMLIDFFSFRPFASQ